MEKLAIITTHPIQYNAPWFKLLAARKKIVIKVFYTWGQLEHKKKYDPGFGKDVAWDIPLLEGYDFTFVVNVSNNPGSDHFRGIDNPTLISDIEEWNPNAILVFGWRFKSHLKVLRYFKGKKTILFRGDSTLLDEAKGFYPRKMARRIFLKWIYSHVNIALFTGSANKDYYVKHGLKPGQLVFAPHAIDNDRFESDVYMNKRQQLEIPEDGIVFLFAGKFEDKKNPFMLLNAFIQINNPDTYLILVGNGKLEKELKCRVKDLDFYIKKRIFFLDFQNQFAMPAVYKTADVFVLPSKGPGETWGLAVNEAMACSRAVLVSDKCGCCVDLVENGINGFAFSSEDVNELTDKMKLLTNKNNTKKMGKASEKIIQNWNYEHICTAIQNTIFKFSN